MWRNARCKPVLEALSKKFCGTSKQLIEFCICLKMVYSAVDLQVFTNTDGLDVVLGEHKCSPILALLYTRKKVVPKFLDLLVFEIFTPQLLACIFLAFNQVWINVTSTNSVWLTGCWWWRGGLAYCCMSVSEWMHISSQCRFVISEWKHMLLGYNHSNPSKGSF